MHTAGIIGIGMPGTPEVLLIIFVILLLFGAKKLPELSRSLGKSLGEFKKGQREGDEPDKEDKTGKKEISSYGVSTETSANGEESEPKE